VAGTKWLRLMRILQGAVQGLLVQAELGMRVEANKSLGWVMVMLVAKSATAPRHN
jgi:hypothetical protein